MSAEPFKLSRIPSLKTVADFRRHVASLGLDLPCDDQILTGSASPLAQPITGLTINGKTIGNRFCVHPMEGWDCTITGEPTENTLRRWHRFGESGAKLIYGGEAMAVRPDGRANPNQLQINETTKAGLAELRETLIRAHQERFGRTDDLVIGFQLTHSGRFCRPNEKARWEPRVAYRHPLLDRKFRVESDAQVLSDDEVKRLIEAYVAAAKVAWDVGADFVDIKHCHGYLLHEFLSAFTRPGDYGGSFENRTRILREIVAGIRTSGNGIDLGVRLSAFDFVPFRPDPALSQPGKLGPGIPEDFSQCLPYRYAFGCNSENPLQYDLTETFQFVELCARLGVKIVNLSAGSPYYNPHIQRPAAYPPCDGYQPAHDPLIDVARQIHVVRQVKERLEEVQSSRFKVQSLVAAPEGGNRPVVVGTAYSYLQEYLPHVAQAVLRAGWVDSVGLGRAMLSYPTMLADAVATGRLTPKLICRTFSDCTTAPRNGLPSGCYPLDKFYTAKPEFQRLKEIKKALGA
ncbi:MAG: NADH:flavin oxidoreductase [Verrucomicrobia bacterium]|nr:NADH:flavin oxidoreductase [Verrucomicrobiota bacterium]